MLEWLKDSLGINKYRMAWNFIDCGVHLKGESGLIVGKLSFVQAVTDSMNRHYGDGTHYIIREA